MGRAAARERARPPGAVTRARRLGVAGPGAIVLRGSGIPVGGCLHPVLEHVFTERGFAALLAGGPEGRTACRTPLPRKLVTILLDGIGATVVLTRPPARLPGR